MTATDRLGVADHEQEAIVVDLIERLELAGTHAAELEAELEALRVHRDLLDVELEHATTVVVELTRQLLAVEEQLAARRVPLRARVLRRSLGGRR